MIRRAIEASRKIGFISSFPPRKCGIATFTADLINSTALAGGDVFEPVVIAMQSHNDTAYDNRVKFKIRKEVKRDYFAAAEYINLSDIDVVSLQHEFGLFGGRGGSHLSLLLENVRKPIVTTLHTVLEDPAPDYARSMNDLCEVSKELIVMNKWGVRMLEDIYSVRRSKIRLVPHGIPDLPFCDGADCKRRLGLAGRRILLTFGLLSRNKGIELVIQALPEIVRADPSVLYLVVGATHPDVLRYEGQSYKSKLEQMVRDLGLQRHVVFDNRFVSDEELFELLGAADIYITPYLHKEQLTSGTLAFAVGAGKAVVSTPYWAAEELLANGRGRLVPFGDSKSIARSIVEILGNERLFSSLRERAYEYGRSRTWARIGEIYWELFQSQLPVVPMPMRSRVDMRGVKVPVHSERQLYRPALKNGYTGR